MVEGLNRILGAIGQPVFTDALWMLNAVIGAAYCFIAIILFDLIRRVRTPVHSVLINFLVFFLSCAVFRWAELRFDPGTQTTTLVAIRFVVSIAAVSCAVSVVGVRKRVVNAMAMAKLARDQKLLQETQIEQLRQSEERFRLLIQGVRDYAIYMLEPGGRVVSWNSGAHRLKGYEESEITGQQFSVFYTPEDIAAGVPEADLKKAAELGRLESDGWRIRKDGSRFWANTVITAIHNSHGERIGFAKVTRDLTERRRAEEALTQSQKFLDSMFENIPSMIFVKEAKDLRFVRFNRAGEELLGYPREDFIGKNDYDFFPREQADYFTSLDRKVLAGGKVVDIQEEQISTRHQGTRILHTRKIPILDSDGKPKYLLGISEDITEQKLAEAESVRVVREQAALAERESAANRAAFLAEASTLLASSLDYHGNLKRLAELTVPVLADWCTVAVVDHDRGDQQVNRVAIVHTDPQKRDAVERLERAFPTTADQSEGIKRVIQTGKSLVTYDVSDEQLVRAAKSPEHLELMRKLGCTSCMIVPILTRDKVHGAISFISSSPEYHFTSEDVQVAEELGRRAGIAIDNALLYEAAQKAISTRDEFLSIASHELKTPITSLKLQLQVARRGTNSALRLAPTPERLEKVLDVSIAQVNRLTALIDDLLDVSRIEAGRLSFSYERLDLSDLVKRMVDRFDEHFRASGCELRVVADEPALVWADPFRMEQVILNLISNATKYGNRKPVMLAVAREKGRVRLVCEDQGIGIPPDRVEHIFERFERAVHYNDISGLGLGLYITREIVRGHHGSIRVESEFKKGSRFIVEFPEYEASLALPFTSEFELGDRSSDSRSRVPSQPHV